MAIHELVLPDGVAIPVGEAPLGVGRGPANDVVLTDDSVSWHHAQLWAEGGGAWVRDLGSRNGTFVNGQRAASSVRLSDGDQIQIGASAVLRLSSASAAAVRWRVRHVEDLSTGVRVLVRGARFVIGSAPGSDLRIDAGPDTAATLIVHDNGELWLATEDGEREVDANTPIEVGGRRLRVVEQETEHAPTIDTGSTTPRYSVVASSGGVDGPLVRVIDLATRRELLLTGNRGVLLYALARQLARDKEAGLPTDELGWCRSEDLLTAVWGRSGKDGNHLNVLLHRLRGQLSDEGLDPWFVEKRRGGLRIRVTHVQFLERSPTSGGEAR
jgi:FHA domain